MPALTDNRERWVVSPHLLPPVRGVDPVKSAETDEKNSLM